MFVYTITGGKDVATVELKKIIYITLKGVGMGVGVILNANKSWH